MRQSLPRIIQNPSFITVFVLLIAGDAAIGQTRYPSHIPMPPPTDIDPAALIQERLLASQEWAGLGDLLKFGAGLDVAQALKILRNNPQTESLVRGMQSGDPDSANRLRNMLTEARRMWVTPPEMSPDDYMRILQRLPSLASGASGDSSQASVPIQSSRSRNRPRASPQDEAARREIAHRMEDLTKRLPEHLPNSLRNSPAVKDLFHRLSATAIDALQGTNADGWDVQLARLESRFHALRGWLPKEMPAALRNLHMPDVTRYAADVSMPQVDLTPASLPRFGEGGMSARSATNLTLALLGSAVAVIVIWRLRGGRFSPANEGRRPLGPWPLDPNMVATRADLIRAFEYLSVLQCGDPARTWHHRAIAEQMGGTVADRRTAADRLATLYERARYAPRTGDEPDWSAARAPLVLLAGAV
jgi:hypothetical protein